MSKDKFHKTLDKNFKKIAPNLIQISHAVVRLQATETAVILMTQSAWTNILTQIRLSVTINTTGQMDTQLNI